VNLDWARITLRMHRFEVVAFAVVLGGLTLAAFAVAAYLDMLRPGPECFAIADTLTPACQRASDAFNTVQQSMGTLLMSPLVIVCYAIGVFLGVPVIARELERGTVRLAWSLSPSRWRWYASRVIPMLVVVAALTFAAGVASDRFFTAASPGEDFSRSFAAYGARGGLLAARAVLVFAAAVVAGSIIGRALPAVILAALIASLGVGGIVQLHQRVLATEAVAIPIEPTGENLGFRPGDLFIDQRFVLPDGSLVGYDYFNATGVVGVDENGNPTFPMVQLVIPGERYRFVEAREAMVLVGASLVALLLAGFVVSRRRPG
jgi:ABC-type transport system involved in multi-copper enzyme maturation permease subunit